MNPFKPNNWLYIGLFLFFLIVSLVSVCICMTSPWFTIVAGLGCGGFASVLVAWMVDAATCKANNKKATLYQQEIFSECCVDAYNNHMEHWKKVNGRWQNITEE